MNMAKEKKKAMNRKSSGTHGSDVPWGDDDLPVLARQHILGEKDQNTLNIMKNKCSKMVGIVCLCCWGSQRTKPNNEETTCHAHPIVIQITKKIVKDTRNRTSRTLATVCYKKKLLSFRNEICNQNKKNVSPSSQPSAPK